MYNNIKYLSDVDVRGKTVLVRVDFNVPLDGKEGYVTEGTRIVESLITLDYLLSRQTKIILLSHLGRPKKYLDKFTSMQIIVKKLQSLRSDIDLHFIGDILSDEGRKRISEIHYGQIFIAENIRYYQEETSTEPQVRQQFAKRLAQCADIFVNDAFGVLHREHASIDSIPQFLPSCAGLLVEKELYIFTKLEQTIKRPYVAVIGGSKISTKLKALQNLLKHVDAILVGGAMAYTFMHARLINIGNSKYEADYLSHASHILDTATYRQRSVHLPVDHIITRDLGASKHKTVPLNILDGWIGADIGPKTIKRYKKIIQKANTIFWNGPMGVFENPAYAKGTSQIAKCIAKSHGTTVIGGGDTLFAAQKNQIINQVTHISTGGGASLKLIEGAKLPGLQALVEVSE